MRSNGLDRLGFPRVRGVVRLDKPGCHGYQVRFYRGHKTLYTRFFGDGRYDGDAEAAYIAACAHRRSLEKRYPRDEKWDRGIRRFYVKPMRHSKTGIAGVHVTKYTGTLGRGRPVAVATWTDADGESKMERFFFDEYGGRAGALAEAKLCREEMVRDTVRTLKARGVRVVFIE